jgi:adenine-specific DNA-methyltransferase
MSVSAPFFIGFILMPTLDWIGKKAVVNHHREVPYHLLKCDRDLSVGDPGSGNLLVQGDNLLALKALLPYYAGRVKCIYIDPPYNTGNENWVYNDAVNSPEIRQWLRQTVGKEGEDLSRHDKWLCMMYPRLQLLRRFLSRDGLIAVSIDDNEVSYLGILLDEIFGPANRLACAPWLAEPSGGKQKTALRKGHEYLLIYHNGNVSNLSREDKSAGELDKRDKFGKYRKGRELLKWGDESLRADRKDMWFPLPAPDGSNAYPIRNDGREGRWRLGDKNPLIEAIRQDPEHAHWEVRPFDEGVVVDGKRERLVPYEKVRDSKKSFGWTTWLDSFGFNADATRELKQIFGTKPFNTPKPTQLIEWVILLHCDENALVLDSFAGSGTTGHAVLDLNKADGGNRRFILVEMEEAICQTVTAQRLTRAIEGYKDVPALGGGFRYCKLGTGLFDQAGNIAGEVRFGDLAAHVFFTETGSPIPKRADAKTPLLGVHQGRAVYLLFNGILGDKRPAGGNVLTHDVAQDLPEHPDGKGLRVVYGEACRLGPKSLSRYGIAFRQIPFELKVD